MSGFRVSIPSSLGKTIQDLKEITGNHSDEEVYAMLKECSMDPNETAQKLLLQDPFHEVKSKRDKRKESLNNREPAESRWRPGTQGRGHKGVRGNYTARYTSHDFVGAKNFTTGKQNGINQVTEKSGSSSVPSQEAKKKEIPSSVPATANGPTAVTSGNPTVPGSGKVKKEVVLTSVGIDTSGSAPPPTNANKTISIAFGTTATHGPPAPNSSSSLVSTTHASSSAGYFSSSDPVLFPSNDPRLPFGVGAIKREVGCQQTPGEQNALPAVNKSTVAASEMSSSSLSGKILNKSQGGGKKQLSESYQPTSATHGGTSVSRPSSNYSNRSQQMSGPQKVSSNKEWKPKSTSSVVAQGPGVAATPEVPDVSVESSSQPQPDSDVLDSEEESLKLQKKTKEMQIPSHQHVILPNHIHVPESERNKFSFGSFGANFVLTSGLLSGSESDKSSTPASENSDVVEETVEEQTSSNQNTLALNEEGDYPDQAQPATTPAPENLSPGDGDVLPSAVPEYNGTKEDTSSLAGGQQCSVAQTSPNSNFGFVSPILGSQLASFENSESQARDVSRLPGFVVQQPFDPASYYAQFYRPGAESDGRLSPFPSPGVATKYNGNVAALPPQTSQSPQEGANSLVLTTAGPTPLVTQAAGHMQSSLAVTQQPIPVFRPPAGMHISHYPPNYLPYGHYFSPFYVPPPMHHQFLSNGCFPQQPQTGNVYPAPPTAVATGVKYPLPQYKPGSNTGNSAHIGMPSGYGPYGSSPPSYNPSSATTAGNSTSEDLGPSQFKDNNVYIPGQQSEGSAMWIGRDMSNMPVSSFYNLPQGQHMTFTPTQPGHGSFPGVYHPAQAVTAATVHPLMQQQHPQTMAGAVEMTGPTANAYQQPQHSQINWPSNY